MKTKYKYLLAALFMLVVSLPVALHHKKGNNQPSLSEAARGLSDEQAPSPATKETQEVSGASVGSQTLPNQNLEEIGIKPGMTKEQAERAVSDWLLIHGGERTEDVSKPIKFLGKVIDESSNGLPDVAVSMFWNDPPPNPQQVVETKTAPDGTFALKAVTGRVLYLSFSKAGYDVSRSNQSNFYFPLESASAGVNSPVFFGMRKRGKGAELVSSQSGVTPYLVVSNATDGTPIWVDFLRRKLGPNGELEVQTWLTLDPVTRKTESWRVRLSIPGGGFVEHHEEFPYFPPDVGYQPVLEFSQVPKDASERIGIYHKKFFIRFGDPARFGWLDVTASGRNGNVILEYAINPSGERYLEPKTHRE